MGVGEQEVKNRLIGSGTIGTCNLLPPSTRRSIRNLKLTMETMVNRKSD